MDIVKYKQELMKANRFNNINRIKSLLSESEYDNNAPILTFKLKKMINEILEWSMKNSLTFVLIELIRHFKFKSKQIKMLWKWCTINNNETLMGDIKTKYKIK